MIIMRFVMYISVSLSVIYVSACGTAHHRDSADAQRTPSKVNGQLPSEMPARDYQSGGPIITVEPAVINADDQPWEQVGEGVRRKVYFNDRLTVVYLEITDGDTRPADPPHHHYHDQIGYVLEGRAIVNLGGKTQQIGPGGVYIVTSNLPHNLKILTDKLVLLEVFTPTREDFRKE